METKLDKAKIRAEAKQMIRAGTSKHDTYEALCEKYKEKITVARIVQPIPSKKARIKYAGLNAMLLIALSIIAFLDLASLNIIGIIIDALLIYIVASYNTGQYSWIIARAFFSILALCLFFIFSNHSDPGVLISFCVLAFLSVSCMVLGIMLGKRLAPDYHERKILYTDSAGKKRVRVEHEFDE
jgi:hypothetical protein